jgi:hypothetical protein
VIPRNPEIPVGTPVEVYWNLHKDVFSVRDRTNRRVLGHCDEVHLTDVSFRVSQAGRLRVIKEKRKNVHAFVRGLISDPALHLRGPIEDYTRARYNPYESAHFMDASSGLLLHGAESARLNAQQSDSGTRRGLVLLRRPSLAL